MLDEIHGVVKKTIHINREFGNELDNQKPMLDHLDNEVL